MALIADTRRQRARDFAEQHILSDFGPLTAAGTWAQLLERRESPEDDERECQEIADLLITFADAEAQSIQSNFESLVEHHHATEKSLKDCRRRYDIPYKQKT